MRSPSRLRTSGRKKAGTTALKIGVIKVREAQLSGCSRAIIMAVPAPEPWPIRFQRQTWPVNSPSTWSKMPQSSWAPGVLAVGHPLAAHALSKAGQIHDHTQTARLHQLGSSGRQFRQDSPGAGISSARGGRRPGAASADSAA